MTATSTEGTAQVLDHTRRLEEYKETVGRLFPSLPRDLVDARSIRDVDALVVALFLRCYPHELGVLEVGTLFGISTFHFASQPSVLSVLSVESDSPPAPEPASDHDVLPGPQDVARAALAEFADVTAKVNLRSGDASNVWTADGGDSPDGPGTPQIPAPELPAGGPLLGFLNGARTREAVSADLSAVFDANPRAVAILEHCRGEGGLVVQAGVASFLERAKGRYAFRLFGDLSPGMATCYLGIVYPETDSEEVHRCLRELGDLFSERLDPLWLASREQELIGIVNTYKDEATSLSGQLQGLNREHQRLADHNTELQKRTSQLEKRKAQLEERQAGLKEEKKGFQKRTSQLEKRKAQLEKDNSRLREEKRVFQGRASQLDRDRSKLQERIARLQERNTRLAEERASLDAQLGAFRTAGRYKLADSVTKNVLRIPGARALARRTRPEE
jgi:hypothetical protein